MFDEVLDQILANKVNTPETTGGQIKTAAMRVATSPWTLAIGGLAVGATVGVLAKGYLDRKETPSVEL